MAPGGEDGKPTMPGALVDIFKKEIGSTNFILSVFVFAIEKMIETEFSCPCNSNSKSFTTGLQVSLTLIFICFTLLIKKEEFEKSSEVSTRLFCVINTILSLVIAALTWLTVWYFDGLYYVCVKSTWEGDWQEGGSERPRKWCYPTGANSTFRMTAKGKSKELFHESQAISVKLFISLTAFFALLTISSVLQKIFEPEKPETNPPNTIEMTQRLNRSY